VALENLDLYVARDFSGLRPLIEYEGCYLDTCYCSLHVAYWLLLMFCLFSIVDPGCLKLDVDDTSITERSGMDASDHIDLELCTYRLEPEAPWTIQIL